RNAFGIHLDAVRSRLGRWCRDQLDLADLGIEPPDHVGILQVEPQNFALIEDERMRVFRIRVGHLVLGDLSRLRVELAYQRPGIARVPNVAALVLDQAMWS